MRINKCWNTIRFLAEHDYFSSDFLAIIEESIKPLLEFLAQPGSIDFDDDLLFCISSIIKKSKVVSQTMRVVFPYLDPLHKKYKGIFGNLLETLNYYIFYGKDFLNDKTNIAMILQMANTSIFNNSPPILLSNNSEGAILL